MCLRNKWFYNIIKNTSYEYIGEYEIERIVECFM
jgi:hypothetical protein